MAEEWGEEKRRRVPQISIRTCSHGNTRGRTRHNPPTIQLWVDEDDMYATYLFLHELAHIAKGPTTHREENHGDKYLRSLAKIVAFFGFDPDYVIEQEVEYVMVRQSYGAK